MFNIITVAFSDFRGGAAKATRQQVLAVRSLDKVSLSFIVAEKKIPGFFSIGPNKVEYYWHFFLRLLSLLITKLQITKNTAKHSLNLFSSRHVLKYCYGKQDCIHLHWFNNETLSIKALDGFLKKTSSLIVITLHDDWFFSGSEHCIDIDSKRYLTGYSKSNCNVKGLDLDRWTFKRKLSLCKLFEQKNVIFTTPSTYLQRKAKKSFLLKNANIVKVPNIIDCSIFKVLNKNNSRQELNLPVNELIVVFGAIGGASYLKGNDLLLSALVYMKSIAPDLKITLVTFGGPSASQEVIAGFDTINLGHISTAEKMAKVYSCADVTIVPSRLEAFGQVAAESLACATPVIAFNNSGLTDIIQHEKSGFLVRSFDVKALGFAIVRILSMPVLTRELMGLEGRRFVKSKFSKEVVIDAWKKIYGIES